MSRNYLLCFVLTAAIALSSCATSEVTQLDVIDQKSVLIYQGDRGNSASFLRREGSNDVICRGPYLDSLKTKSEQANLGISGVGEGEGIGESESQGATSLGGMSPTVLVSSELLYRACELAANINADAALTLKIYEKFLLLIEKAILHQMSKGSSPESLSPDKLTPAPEPQVIAPTSKEKKSSDN